MATYLYMEGTDVSQKKDLPDQDERESIDNGDLVVCKFEEGEFFVAEVDGDVEDGYDLTWRKVTNG